MDLLAKLLPLLPPQHVPLAAHGLISPAEPRWALTLSPPQPDWPPLPAPPLGFLQSRMLLVKKHSRLATLLSRLHGLPLPPVAAQFLEGRLGL